MNMRDQSGSVLLKVLIFMTVAGLALVILLPQAEMRAKELEISQAREEMLALLSFENRYFTTNREYTANLDTLQKFLNEQTETYKTMIDDLKAFIQSENMLESDSLLLDFAAKTEELKLYFQYDRKEYTPVLDTLGRFMKYVGQVNSKRDYYNSIFDMVIEYTSGSEGSCLTIDKLQPIFLATDSLDFAMLHAEGKVVTVIEDTLEMVLSLEEAAEFKLDYPKATVIPRDFVTAIDSIKHYIQYVHFLDPCNEAHSVMLEDLENFFIEGLKEPAELKRFAVTADSLKWLYRFTDREYSETLGRIRGFLLFKAGLKPRISELSGKFDEIFGTLEVLPEGYRGFKEASDLVDTLKSVFRFSVQEEGVVPYTTRLDSITNYFYAPYSWAKTIKDSLKAAIADTSTEEEMDAALAEIVSKKREAIQDSDIQIRSEFKSMIEELKGRFLNENVDGEIASFSWWLPMIENLQETNMRERDAENEGFSDFTGRMRDLKDLFNTTMDGTEAEIRRHGAKLDLITSLPPSEVPFYCPDFPGVRYKVEVELSKVNILPFDVAKHGHIREGEAVW